MLNKILDFLLGQLVHTLETPSKKKRVDIPLPEKIYKAWVSFSVHSYKRKRWFKSSQIRYEIIPHRPIPVPPPPDSRINDYVWMHKGVTTTFRINSWPISAIQKRVFYLRKIRSGSSSWVPPDGMG